MHAKWNHPLHYQPLHRVTCCCISRELPDPRKYWRLQSQNAGDYSRYQYYCNDASLSLGSFNYLGKMRRPKESRRGQHLDEGRYLRLASNPGSEGIREWEEEGCLGSECLGRGRSAEQMAMSRMACLLVKCLLCYLVWKIFSVNAESVKERK